MCLRAAAAPRLLGCLALQQRLGSTERLASSIASKGKGPAVQYRLPSTTAES